MQNVESLVIGDYIRHSNTLCEITEKKVKGGNVVYKIVGMIDKTLHGGSDPRSGCYKQDIKTKRLHFFLKDKICKEEPDFKLGDIVLCNEIEAVVIAIWCSEDSVPLYQLDLGGCYYSEHLKLHTRRTYSLVEKSEIEKIIDRLNELENEVERLKRKK